MDDKAALNALRLGIEISHPKVTCSMELRHGDEPLLWLNLIAVPAALRGKGVAREILNTIIATADERGWSIRIEPSTGFGADLRRLVGWYRRVGFELSAPGLMMRRPRPVAVR